MIIFLDKAMTWHGIAAQPQWGVQRQWVAPFGGGRDGQHIVGRCTTDATSIAERFDFRHYQWLGHNGLSRPTTDAWQIGVEGGDGVGDDGGAAVILYFAFAADTCATLKKNTNQISSCQLYPIVSLDSLLDPCTFSEF